MSVSFTVGGAKGTFQGRHASSVAGVLDRAFGGETDWEGVEPRHFGGLAETRWADFQACAVAELGAEALPNLLAMGDEGRGVYLPAHVQAVTLPVTGVGPLSVASLPGLRRELNDLAERWELPLDDEALADILHVHHDPDDGWVADAPEVLAYARLALAANEAVRKDCPLWLMG